MTHRYTSIEGTALIKSTQTHTCERHPQQDLLPTLFVLQVGEPSAVLLLKCSADTMSSRLQQCRGRSTSALHPASDRDGGLHRRAESFCSDSQAVASHYEGKKLLHTVSVLFFCFSFGGMQPVQIPDF